MSADFMERIIQRIQRMGMPPGYNGILLGGSFGSTDAHRAAEWVRYDETKPERGTPEYEAYGLLPYAKKDPPRLSASWEHLPDVTEGL